jgi:uncharacterized protein
MGVKLSLRKKPKGVTIIEGFPGIGLVGTITTEFLTGHLETEKIGSVLIDDVPAIVAVHSSKVIEPISIHYNKKYNIVIVHAISLGKGVGWDIAEIIQQLASELQAKEIVSIEGVGSMKPDGPKNVFYYSTDMKNKKKLDSAAKPLKEGIIVGVTGALLARREHNKTPITAFFAETQSNLPDSKSSAAIIKALDTYLNLKVDPKPLLKQAQQFEGKLKNLMSHAKKTQGMQKKQPNYFG